MVNTEGLIVKALKRKLKDDESSEVEKKSKNTLKEVQDYYGKVLSVTDDLRTNACKTGSKPPQYIIDCLLNIHEDVLSKYYGCGLCIPEGLEGLTVLDLGCGAGRDVYIASQLVGKNGRVIGVDMTDEQINVAKRTQDFHKEKFGFSNTDFYTGFIERLDELPIEKGSVDVIISNCVINLSPDKDAVLQGCYELLKEGGEIYFSDVYSNRRVPQSLRDNQVLWGECISGALYWNDFINMSKKYGFLDPRLVADSVITVENEKLEKLCGKCEFVSATYRLFKLPLLESHCEDYGQAVIYKGTLERCEDSFLLDDHHEIETNKVFPVCGNTWRMLKETRFAKHFEFIGNFDIHYGIYEGCGTAPPMAFVSNINTPGEGGCC